MLSNDPAVSVTVTTADVSPPVVPPAPSAVAAPVRFMDHVVRAVFSQPLAILPEKLHEILAFLEFRSQGGVLTTEEIRERIGAVAQRSEPQQAGAVAVLPVIGTISQRVGMLGESSGGVGTDKLGKRFDLLVKDPEVAAIVLDVDSPGGSVYGVEELSRKIYDARTKKPVVAVANSMAASAGYWIASSASELFVSPGGEVGSIGVFAAHDDISGAMGMLGVKTTLVSAGKYKIEGNPFEPLSKDARDFMQLRVDDYYGMFTRAVARNRGVTVDEVRGGFGQGRMVGADAAVRERMADRKGTLEDAIRRAAALSGRAVTRSVAAARRKLDLMTKYGGT